MAEIDRENFTLGLIGAGNIAQSIATGLTNLKILPFSRIFTAHRNPDSRTAFSSLGIKVYHHNSQVVEQCDVIILAVKPHILKEVILELRPLLSSDKLLVSVAVGHKLKTLQEWAGHGRVIRVIPNTASAVGEAAIAMHVGEAATEDDTALVSHLFGAIGRVWNIDEKLSAAAGVIGASGPAFAYMAIEAMSDGGVAAGLPRDIALGLAAQSFLGAASMIIKSGKHPGELKDQVTSPGGCTIAGVHELERGAFRASIMNAVLTATDRVADLGK